MRSVLGLVLFLGSLFLSACRVTEDYRLQRPAGLLKAQYAVEFQGEPIELHVRYPDNARSDEQVALQVTFEQKREGLYVGVDPATGYEVGAFTLQEGTKTRLALHLILRERQAPLPPHTPSPEKVFDDNKIFPAVARLLIETKSEVSFCNAFYIGSRRFLTAEHCLSEQATCQGIRCDFLGPIRSIAGVSL